jgi:hypothetical protein
MTAKEHQLIVYMFAQQTIRFKALLEILKARGILEADDFMAFEHLAHEQMGPELTVAVIDQYTEFAKGLGLEDQLPH